jgi:hypothetical protein
LRADEEALGTGQWRPTLLFNSYAEQVAGLYQGMSQARLYM